MSLELFVDDTPGQGLFVTIDGPNASGKTSIADEVELQLEALQVPVHGTRQPSGSNLGALAREAEGAIGGRALACLVAADRHQQLATEIGPALAGGAVVVCDRYVESSLVLQRMDGVELDYVLAVNAGILRPHIRVRLVASEGVLLSRLASRAGVPGRRFEGMPDGAALELAMYAEADDLLTAQYSLPSVVLDTTDSAVPDQARQVADHIQRQLRRRSDG